MTRFSGPTGPERKRRPARGGAVLLGGERPISTAARPRIQANDAMRARLSELLWGRWWRPRFKSADPSVELVRATTAEGHTA